jgi:hypothetical protein
MAELDGDAAQTALALQTEIRHKRAQVVADMDELRHAVRVRTSLTYILHTHPQIMRGVTIALGVAGIATLALLFRATRRRSRLS